MITYREISLGQISPNPNNPRKRCDPKALEELAASIKAKGVLEPIIVRPAGKAFEIVAGERRYRASKLAGLAEIPAIVRELTDDEAFDIMIIENIQRSDLTDREEAESFKSYVAHHKGEDGILALAEKTGITPAYIRSRIRVLELPAKVLKAWDEGKLVFGHLQQLVRIHDEGELKETVDRLFQWRMTVKDLATHIDEQTPVLSSAFFPTKERCSKCPSNSAVQRDLFGVESKGTRCLNPACFKKHQQEWLAENWKTTALAKKHGTSAARLCEAGYSSELRSFYSFHPHLKKCLSCPDFVTVIETTGHVRSERACAGAKSCYDSVTNPRSSKEAETGKRDPSAPRAKWHGEFFRDVFLTKRIPEKLAELDPAGPVARALLLACAIHGHRSELDVRESYAGAILQRNPAEVDAAVLKTIEKIILSGKHVGPSNWNGFGTKGRQLVAALLGIDLAKEYAVDAEYLEKKTKAEILAFLKKFNLGGKFGDLETAAKLKKPELVKGILSLGDKLVGKVPAEILK